MGKKLSEMTLKELWQLFPIFLTEHQACWEEWYKEEDKFLSSILQGQQIVRISHIGSTAIKDIWAKPIIDILVEITRETDMLVLKEILLANGYLCMSQNERGMSFNKGYTENGFAEKVFHLHLRYAGDNDELYFRDYMNENADKAREYEKLKLSLWPLYEHDRDGYTDAKTDFVSKITKMARKKYGDRYKI